MSERDTIYSIYKHIKKVYINKRLLIGQIINGKTSQSKNDVYRNSKVKQFFWVTVVLHTTWHRSNCFLWLKIHDHQLLTNLQGMLVAYDNILIN